MAPAPVHATALYGETVSAAEGDASVAAVMAPPAAEAGVAEAAEAKPAAEARPKRRGAKWGGRVAWLMAMMTVGVLLGILIILGLKFVDGPVSSAQTLKLAQLQASNAPVPAVNTLGGQFVELKYPGVFDQLGRSKGSVHALEAYVLSSRTSYGRQIAIEVSALPSNLLDDDSSFKFRSISSDKYTPVKTTLMGEAATIFVKPDKSERTLFWAHKGREIAVSLTTDNPGKDDLESYLQTILPTIHWRQ
ncbi:MAG TPA: hypothetical protein VI322_01800 [Candidatus Saccharimonadia bacterium]